MTQTTAREAPGVDRRSFMAGSATAAIVVAGGALIHSGEAWGLEVKNLKPETMRTLIKMARDIFPHDRVADKFYAAAMKGFDDKASDAAVKKDIEDGVAALDAAAKAAHKVGYADVGWEAQRTKLLEGIQGTPFFGGIRGNMVVSLYNQKEVWPLFGYEGESASKGGYINRGFNDINWL
jgi:hypothetical protein